MIFYLHTYFTVYRKKELSSIEGNDEDSKGPMIVHVIDVVETLTTYSLRLYRDKIDEDGLYYRKL